MEVIIEIKEKKVRDDYFPCLFANNNKSVVILADGRTSEKTFSGMVIYAAGDDRKRTTLGTYSTGWAYSQFTRLPKGSEITLCITQENG
jgi:hypothetical protein